MMPGDTYVPYRLEPDTFPFVKSLMLGEADEINRPSAARSLLPLRPLEPVTDLDGTAFARQMSELTNWPACVQPQDTLHTSPDCFVFVDPAATPVRFAINEFYKTLNARRPQFLEVDASGNLGGAAHAVDAFRKLTPVRHACIVEHFSAAETDNRLLLGATILSAASVEQVSTIRGRWYHEVSYPDKSALRHFMLRVGHLAARQMQG